jgi:type IV pilus assembly protein PilB
MGVDYNKILGYLRNFAPDTFSKGDYASFDSVDALKAQLMSDFSLEELTRIYGEILGVEFVDLKGVEISKEVQDVFRINVLETYQLVPFKKEQDEVWVAMSDPGDYNARHALDFVVQGKQLKIKVFIATPDSIKEKIDSIKGMDSQVADTLKEIQEKKEAEDLQSQKPKNPSQFGSNEFESAPVIKMVSVIIKNAVEGSASDIHIERSEEKVRVRFRVDGILHTSLLLPKEIHSAVVARIKILSNLKIDETRKPQDGRFSIVEGDKKIDFRVSTFPTPFGEKVVIRILNSNKKVGSLTDLGFVGPRAKFIEVASHSPYGMLLVTGPTGSGKSTTLYTILANINNEKINIVTLEDPIEYHLEGVNQSQVHPEIGYTFANGLRSILRQDPNVIMVGEIRDGETAGLAVQSALTGHLVFSTLHTNDALGAVPRLMNMGVEPFLLTASLKVVVAQRLVRMLCVKCKKKVPIDSKIKNYVEKSLKDLDIDVVKTIYAGDYNSVYEPNGCNECQSGYKGRIAIFEALPIDESMKDIIERGFNDKEVHEYVKQSAFLTLKQDGVLKMLNGEISFEELLRVVES